MNPSDKSFTSNNLLSDFAHPAESRKPYIPPPISDEATVSPSPEEIVETTMVEEEHQVVAETEPAFEEPPEEVTYQAESPKDRFDDITSVAEKQHEEFTPTFNESGHGIKQDDDEDKVVDEEPSIPDAPQEEVDLKTPKMNFSLKWEARFNGKKPKTFTPTIFTELCLPPIGAEELNARATDHPDEEWYQTDEQLNYLAYFTKAAENYTYFNQFAQAFAREHSNWMQFIESESGPLCLNKPTFNSNSGEMLTGDRAMMKISAIMNIGHLMNVPLWHTGIWLKLKPPSEAALLALETRIGEEKAKLGRDTTGMVFSNSSAYIINYLMDLIFSCVYDCSYKNMSPDVLKRMIKITDIPSLVWAFACTIYPNGYPLAQPCINMPEKCMNVIHEMVLMSKLCWIDKSQLTQSQIKHMSQRDKHFTDDEIKRYQDDLLVSGDKIITITPKMKMLLSVPSIQEYIDSGYNWVDGIEKMVAESFAATKQGDDRNNYIFNMSRTMVLRQFSHWIKEIHLYDNPDDPDSINKIVDRKSIDESTELLSKDEEIVDTIGVLIGEYTEQSTIAVIGIPRYGCPVCKEDQGKYLPVERYIIPLDMIKVFFTLQSQRLLKVMLATR